MEILISIACWGKPSAGNLTFMNSESLSNLLSENRTSQPTKEFANSANAQPGIYDEAERDRLAFWEKQAEQLHWHKRWNQVLDWKVPFAQWVS